MAHRVLLGRHRGRRPAARDQECAAAARDCRPYPRQNYTATMRNPIAPRPGYLTHPAIVDDTVVFCCEDDLWLVAAAGGSARRLTSAMSRATAPRMSPDGAQIAFCCQNDGPAEVYV